MLGLKEDSLDTQLIGNYEEGDLNHEIIEKFFRHRIEFNGGILPVTNDDGIFNDEKEIASLISEIAFDSINRNFNADFSESPLAKTTLTSQIPAITANILNFLHSFCKPQKKGFGNFTINGVEEWFSTEAEGCSYSGKIDCILNDGENFYIVDFKTGEPPAVKDCVLSENGSLSDFQIPLYMELWNKNNSPHKVENALFYSINKAASRFVVQPDCRKKGGQKSAQEYEAVIDVMKDYTKVFCKKINASDFIPASDYADIYNNVDTYRHCKKCAFKTVCRTVFSIGNRPLKEAEQEGAEK